MQYNNINNNPNDASAIIIYQKKKSFTKFKVK